MNQTLSTTVTSVTLRQQMKKYYSFCSFARKKKEKFSSEIKKNTEHSKYIYSTMSTTIANEKTGIFIFIYV